MVPPRGLTLLPRVSLARPPRSQFRSGMEGPLPWRGSLVWPALCQTNSFHGSPPGANLLTKSFTSKASNWDLGSVTPSPPCAIGSASVSHLTLARVGVSLPPQIKGNLVDSSTREPTLPSSRFFFLFLFFCFA